MSSLAASLSLSIALSLVPSEERATSISAAPIARSKRLKPCAVVLVHTRYHEETRAPTVRRYSIRRLVREWTDELRQTEWRAAAPIPLTLRQARALLPSPGEYGPAGGGGLFFDIGDGTMSYRFDRAGRTIRVGWDPAADSSDYVYEYSYTCTSRRRRPVYADESAAP